MNAAQIVLAIASGAAFGLPILAVAVFAARPFARAATRFRIYAAAFIAAALCAPFALLFSLLRPAAPAVHGPLDARFTAHAPPVLLAALCVVALVLLGDLALDLIRLMRIKARSSIDPAQPRQARNAPVAASERVRTPTAIGYVHPRIVVPADLGGRVSTAELRAIVAHESAHLARYDDWSKAAQIAIVRLCWFTPALWVLAARLDLERELASDEQVLSGAAVDPRAYAACLVRLASEGGHLRAAPAAWTARSQVAVRVERLLRPAAPPARLRGAFAVLSLAVALAVSGLCSALVVPAAHHAEPAISAVPLVALVEPRALVTRPRAETRPRVRPARPPKPALPARKTTVVVPAGPMIAGASAPVVQRPGKAVVARVFVPRSVDQGAVTVPAGPCRMCVMLRRPVVDGPAVPSEPVPPSSSAAPAAAFEEGAGLDDGRAYPWEPDALPWQARRTFFRLVPVSH